MDTINIHQAKTHLSRLVEQAAKGQSFVIAKAGKPLVKVVPLEEATFSAQRIGFMQGQLHIPEDFDLMSSEEIGSLFNKPL